MLHLTRAVAWLSGLALLAWGCAAALVVFQMVGDCPAPLGGFVGLIAVTLTVTAVQMAKREGPAVQVMPAPLDGALSEHRSQVTVPNLTRVRAVALPRFTPWASPSGALSVAEMGQLFRLGALDAKDDGDHRHHA